MNLLGLDVGEKRIGMALANEVARIPSPLGIVSPEELVTDFGNIVQDHNVKEIIVGLPTRIDGTDSEQTRKIRAFAETLKQQTNLEITFADESLSSRDARELIAKNKKYKDRKYYDDLSACYILEEHLKGGLN